MKHTSSYLLLEVCWLAGAKAYYNGQEEMDNPYSLHSRESDFWSDGWWEACLGEGNLSEDLLSHAHAPALIISTPLCS